jgi:hypothetical protein
MIYLIEIAPTHRGVKLERVVLRLPAALEAWSVDAGADEGSWDAISSCRAGSSCE